MNDEIREIEEWLKDISTPTGLSYSGDRTLSNSMVDKIIDYITNLQQENEDYKSIVEKASEFIEWHYKDNKEFYKNKGIGLNYPECDYLLNILQNGSDVSVKD